MMNRSHIAFRETPHSHSRRGSVLIVAMWIALVLVTVALLFAQSMTLEYKAANNTVAGLSANQAIEAARRYALLLLTELEEPGTMPDIELYEWENVTVGDAAFWFIGRGDGDIPSDTPVFGLSDEASKLNLNVATAEMLEALPNMTSELAAAIVDWRDSDQEITPNGAETEAYLLRDPKYLCKDSPFETVEELRLVYGAEWDLLCNEDVNRNGVLDPGENDGEASPPYDNQDGRLDPGLLEYLTVYSREPNTEDDGEAFKTGLVNVNTASATVLACLPGMTEASAQQLVAYRLGQDEALESADWVSEVLDEESATAVSPYITTKTYQYTVDIAAVDAVGRGYRRVLFVIDTSGDEPTVVYRQDRSRLGWALGTSVRQSLTSEREI